MTRQPVISSLPPRSGIPNRRDRAVLLDCSSMASLEAGQALEMNSTHESAQSQDSWIMSRPLLSLKAAK
jgi:hypothetical protein